MKFGLSRAFKQDPELREARLVRMPAFCRQERLLKWFGFLCEACGEEGRPALLFGDGSCCRSMVLRAFQRHRRNWDT